jgi:hypothetical protein
MKLVNTNTGAAEDLSFDEGLRALASGSHAPPEGFGVVMSPQNELELAPAQNISDQIGSMGYRIPEPSELMGLSKTARLEKPIEQLKTFGAGALSLATFGGSDIALPEMGLATKQGLRERREYDPNLTMAGNITGLLGSSFIPFSPVGLLGRGIYASEKALLGAASKVLPNIVAESALGRLALKTGAKGLGSAIEGAAYGVGEIISEHALGDSKLTAEQMLAKVGTSAMYNGLLGSALVPLGAGIKKTIGGARAAYNGMKESILGKFVPSAANDAAAVSRLGVGPKEPLPPGMLEPEANVANPEGILHELANPKQAKTAFSAKPINTGFAPGEVPPPTISPLDREPGPFEKNPKDPEFVPGIFTKASASVKAAMSGQEYSEIIGAIAQQMDTSKIMLSPAAKTKQISFIRNQLDTLYNTTENSVNKFYENARPLEVEKLLGNMPHGDALDALEPIISAGEGVLNKFKEKEVQYSPAMVSKFNDAIERVTSNALKAESGAGAYKAADEFKRELDGIIKWDKKDIPYPDANTVEVLKGYRSALRSTLENQNNWGEMAARQASLNNAVSDWIRATGKGSDLRRKLMERTQDGYVFGHVKMNTFMNMINNDRTQLSRQALDNMWKAAGPLIDQLEAGYLNAPGHTFPAKDIKDLITKSAGNAINSKNYVASKFGGQGYISDIGWGSIIGGAKGAGMAAAKAATDPVAAAKVLSIVEKISSSTVKSVDAAAQYLFDKKNFGVKITAPIILQNAKETDERYKEAVSTVKKFSQNGSNMMDMLQKNTQHLSIYAPKITEAVHNATVSATNFLASKIPVMPMNYIFDGKNEPSNARKAQFVRYYDALDNPHVLLDQIKANYILPETVEAISKVFPEYFNYVKGQIATEMTNIMAHGKLELPFQKRVSLSKFLGMPLDSSMAPGQLSRTQQTLQQIAGATANKEQNEQQARKQIISKGSNSGAMKLSLSERSKPISEQIATRK